MSSPPLPELPVIPSQEVLPGMGNLVHEGSMVTIHDLQLFCQYFYIPLDLHGCNYTMPFGKPNIILPSERVLWEFVHLIQLPLLRDPDANDLTPINTIVTVRRALKLREYIKLKLDEASVRAPAWNVAAVERMQGVCEYQLIVYSKDEDVLIANYKATANEAQKAQLDNFLKIIDEGWLRLAGVPIGRSVVADSFKRATLVGPEYAVLWTAWHFT